MATRISSACQIAHQRGSVDTARTAFGETPVITLVIRLPHKGAGGRFESNHRLRDEREWILAHSERTLHARAGVVYPGVGSLTDRCGIANHTSIASANTLAHV